jgi:predicted Zn-dependent protease
MQIRYLKRGDADGAAVAQKSSRPRRTRFQPTSGQALLETGDVDGAIKELLIGITLAPDSPALYFMLARAHQRAGRTDANREREEFASTPAARSGPERCR